MYKNKIYTEDELRVLTVKQKKSLCKVNGISGYSRMNKDELIRVLLFQGQEGKGGCDKNGNILWIKLMEVRLWVKKRLNLVHFAQWCTIFAFVVSAASADPQKARSNIDYFESTISDFRFAFEEAHKKFSILILPFNRREDCSNKEVYFEETLRERYFRLNRDRELGLEVRILKSFAPGKSEDEVFEVAKEKGADLVIWGDFYGECESTHTTDIRYNLVKDRYFDNKALRSFKLEDLNLGTLKADVNFIVYWTLGLNAYFDGAIKEALELWSPLFERDDILDRDNMSDTEYAEHLNRLGFYAYASRSYDDAFSYFRQSYELLQKEGSKAKQRLMLRNMGRVKLGQFEPDAAHLFARQSLELQGEGAEGSYEAIQAHRIITLSSMMKGDFEAAMVYQDLVTTDWKKNQSQFHQEEYFDVLASCLYCKGVLLHESGDDERAAALYEESIASITKWRGKDARQLMGPYLAYATLHYRTANYEEATRFLEEYGRIESLHAVTDKTYERAEYYERMGLIHLEQGHLKTAMDHFQESLSILIEVVPNNCGLFSSNLYSLGEVYMKQGDFETAESYYLEAYEAAVGFMGPENRISELVLPKLKELGVKVPAL